MPNESRIQTTNKTRDIFRNFVGHNLVPGIICSKCNINLLTFDAFQKEIIRKHEDLLKIKQEVVQMETEIKGEELIEGIIFEEDVAGQLEATTSDTVNQTSSFNEEDDENDVIVLPEEPQVPIDLDAISDDPAAEDANDNAPEEILYKCDHCTAVSSKKDVIVKHIKQSHTFRCEQCGKVYPKMERLESHINRVHNAAAGNKRKQALRPIGTEDQLRFRLKQRPYGRPWPSVVAKRKEELA